MLFYVYGRFPSLHVQHIHAQTLRDQKREFFSWKLESQLVEPLHGGGGGGRRELNLGPLKGQQVRLTTEHLSSSKCLLFKTIYYDLI